MKPSLGVDLKLGDDPRKMGDSLAEWYAKHPVVRRLWAIAPHHAGVANRPFASVRIVLMLEPSLDGEETSASWLANGSAWAYELQQRLLTGIDLECIDGPLAEEFEIDGEGVLLTALCWRDATSAAF